MIEHRADVVEAKDAVAHAGRRVAMVEHGDGQAVIVRRDVEGMQRSGDGVQIEVFEHKMRVLRGKSGDLVVCNHA